MQTATIMFKLSYLDNRNMDLNRHVVRAMKMAWCGKIPVNVVENILLFYLFYQLFYLVIRQSTYFCLRFLSLELVAAFLSSTVELHIILFLLASNKHIAVQYIVFV